VTLAQAVIGDFDEAAQMHLVAHVLLANLVSSQPQFFEPRAVRLGEPVQHFLAIGRVHDYLPSSCHGRRVAASRGA
jgi:hypothetical protein